MKIKFLLICILSSTIHLFSQEIAVTEKGDTVLLYNNGFWEYYNEYKEYDVTENKIKFDSVLYSKPKKSNKKVVNQKDVYTLFYDNKKWLRIPAGRINSEAEFVFKDKNNEAFSILIYESFNIKVEELAQIAYENALNVAPDMEILLKEYRIVNKDTVLHMVMSGTLSSIHFVYDSYYKSNKNGSLQLITYTSKNKYASLKEKMQDFLNGLFFKKEE